MLTATVFLPAAGALFIALFLHRPRAIRMTALLVGVADFLLSLVVFAGYDRAAGGFQWVERARWVPLDAIPIYYALGVDGISAPLVLLTGLLGLSAILVSWTIPVRVREYFVWLLVLQTAVMGVFTSLDFILFFLLWELELVPMYFLIALWGTGRKEYSAMKFLVFTFTGSAFMLVAILALFFSTGTFDIPTLLASDLKALVLPVPLVFAFLFIAFGVKLPVWPLHTWLPDAHTDAPTAVSVMLAGVLLKMGGYGLLRFNAGLFPGLMQDAAFWFALLGVINTLYGAMVTLRQTDLKRLIAYSSISHMGFVLLGLSSLGARGEALSPVGTTGAALQMFTHGTITGLLFVMVGLVYDKTHTRHIPDLGGLASRMPYTASLFVLAGLASLGLPSLSGFVAEVLVFLGTFPVFGVLTALGALGIVLTAGYILWALQRALFGPLKPRWTGLTEVSAMERVAPALLALAIVAVGVYPAVLTDVLHTGVAELLTARFAWGGP